MPDYIYLLENRLSASQQSALRVVRELARTAQMPVFLIGDAVRDLTCGNSVRDLEVVVHGNVLELKKAIVASGGVVWGESTSARRLYLRFPGGVRLDLTSARKTDYPKCGKPVYTWASIHEDLRSRDFTVNAMAISLNDGSYGLLMDPTNGVADIETRHLRLVSNYGFLEEPARLIRAARLRVRLGFELEERTQRRYENAKAEEIVGQLSDEERSRELEQISHEEEPLKVMEAFEADGWMNALFPGWTSAKADTEKLRALLELLIELQMQGVHPDVSASQMQLLTAKVSAKDLAELKKGMLRPGFVEEWNRLDASAAEFAKVLLAKENARPSATYTLFISYSPEAVLWLGFTSKQTAIQEKYRSFLKEWPLFRQRIPHSLMLEMRITPELPVYAELAQKIFLDLLDGGLTTVEEMRAFLEPYSPPAPPPPVTIKRSRAKKSAEVRMKVRVDDDEDELGEDGDDAEPEDVDGLEIDGDDMDFALGDGEDRALLTETEGDDDDVFARDSVSGDVDLVEDEDESDLDGGEDDDPKPPRGAKTDKGSRASKSAAKASVKSMPAKSASAKTEARETATKLESRGDQAKAAGKPAVKIPVVKAPVVKTPVGKVSAKAAAKPPTQPAKDSSKSSSKSAKAPAKQVAAPAAKKSVSPATKVASKTGSSRKPAGKTVARPLPAPTKHASKSAHSAREAHPDAKKASKMAPKAVSRGGASSAKSGAGKKGKKR